MKKLLFAVAMMLNLILSGWAEPEAVVEESADTGLHFDLTLDLYSAYVWRGCVVNDRPVWQPAGTLAYETGDYGTFLAGVWANFDMTKRNKAHTGGGLNEIDYTANYSIDVADFTLDAGHIWYTFPKASGSDYLGSTREIYGAVTYNHELLTPAFSAYYDYAAVDGWYLNSSLNKEVGVGDQLTLGAESSLGWGSAHYMSGYFSTGGSGFADLNFALYAAYALTDQVTIGLKLAYTILLDSDARDNEVYRDENIVWGGLNLAASF